MPSASTLLLRWLRFHGPGSEVFVISQVLFIFRGLLILVSNDGSFWASKCIATYRLILRLPEDLPI